MQLKHYGYLIFLIAMFAGKAMSAEEGMNANETAESNLALNRPVVTGGGYLSKLVDGDKGANDIEYRQVIRERGYWIKIDFEQASNVETIRTYGDARTINHNVHSIENEFLLLPSKMEIPDQTKHYSCHKDDAGPTGEETAMPPVVQCSSSEKFEAFALVLYCGVSMYIGELTFEGPGGTEIAVVKTPTSGGGRFHLAVDGSSEYKDCVVNGGSAPVWLTIELDQPYRMTRINIEGKASKALIHFLLVRSKNDFPDPTNDFSCFNMTVNEEDMTIPDSKNCSTLSGYRIFALWGAEGAKFKINEIKIYGVPAPPIDDNAYYLGVSTTVLLGCQVLVLLIQHNMQ